MSKHGVFIYEEGTAISAPQISSAGVQVVIGTAPVNMVDDPSAVVNTPILANSAQEAMAALGYSTDFQKYTLCQTMYATNNIYQVAPVVYINVLDPDVHKAAVSETEVAVSNMQATVAIQGILRKGLVVKAGSTTLTAGTDLSILIAPGWSQNATVGIALAAKAANINGVFKAIALVDLDTAQATKYTDCKTIKESSGFTSKFCYPLWPCFKVGEYIFAASAIAAALIAYTDAENEDVPSVSPSNEALGITGTCLADGTEVVVDQDQGSTVNTYGVATAINMNGWKLWGNYTGAYPSSADPKDIWLPVRRMFNWQGNNFILTYFEKVDDPMNTILIESVVDSENVRCAAYAPRHWAGASIEYLEADNPITDILAGKMTFRQRIAPYTPAQEIDNILTYDTELLQSVLVGGE